MNVVKDYQDTNGNNLTVTTCGPHRRKTRIGTQYAVLARCKNWDQLSTSIVETDVIVLITTTRPYIVLTVYSFYVQLPDLTSHPVLLSGFMSTVTFTSLH